MALHRQGVRTGQARRARSHHRHLATCVWRPREHRCGAILHHRVHRVTLQPPDLHRLALLRLAHTHGLAQFLRGAHPGAHPPQRVGRQDGLRGTAHIPIGDAVDEARHIDAGRAGGLAGRIEAIQTALGFDHRLHGRQGRRLGRLQALRVRGCGQTTRPHIVEGALGHGGFSLLDKLTRWSGLCGTRMLKPCQRLWAGRRTPTVQAP